MPTKEHTAQLLERAEELAAVERALAAARDGSGRCLVLEGQAGLGKSRLLAAAREAAAGAGAAALHGRGDELEAEFSFGVALQLFAPALAAAAPRERERLLSGAAALTRPLFDAADAPGAADEREQAFSVFHGLHWLAAGLAEGAPLLIAVDDAHWADALSLRFLNYLLQRLDELPVAVIVALRPGAGEPQRRLAARLAAHPLSEALALGPLSEGAVTELVTARLGAAATPELCQACATATGGNPFHLQELTTALAADGPSAADPVRRVEELAGDAAGRALLARLMALPAAAGRLAEAVAVLGDGAPLGDAARLAELDPDAAAAAADELARSAMLGPGTPLAFTHPIVRAAVYEHIPSASRARGHATAAGLLAEAGSDPERVASHLLAAHGAAEPWAAGALREAARHARARGAGRAAVRYLRGAVAQTDGGERADVLLELAVAEAYAHDPEAPGRATEALDALAPGHERAAAAHRLGEAFGGGGDHQAAATVLERGIAELEDGSPEGAGDGDLLRTLGALRVALGGFEYATRAPGGLDAIVERAARGEASAAERLMLAHSALAEGLTGGSAARVGRLAHAALGREDPSDRGVSPVSSRILAATALVVADELVEAADVLSAAIAAARQRGSVLVFATASHARAHAWYRLGRLEDAVADSQAAIDASRYGWEPELPSAHAVLALALMELGEMTAAAAALDLPGGEERWSASFTWNDYLEARGRLRLLSGDPEAALEDCMACGHSLEAMSTSHASVVPWRSTAVRAALALGDHERAGQLAERDLELARAFGAPRALALTLRTAGTVAGGDRGVALLREAVETVEGTGAELEHAHACFELGAALYAEGHRLAARDPLKTALDLADRCGATPLAERARAELVAAGARPRRARAQGSDALTPRELRLARMAAEGMTNRQIAEGLFITTKTVETHLGRVYRKLEIDSRGGLAAALAGEASSEPAP
ncbi:MAG: AAA family ATPase [Thermoleophilaceae bacterium]